MYGRRPVEEAVRAERAERVLVANGTPAPEEIRRGAARLGVPLESVEPGRLASLTGSALHQGVAALVAAPALMTPGMLLERAVGVPLLLALDGVQDPQNLGAALRSAAAAGASGAIIPRHRAAPVTGAVIKASAGTALSLPLASVSSLAACLVDLGRAGVWTVGLDADGEVAHDQADLTMPLVLVVGAEGSGLSRLVRERCDLLVRIPMAAGVESLNVAAAAAVALFEARRQRGWE
ncbi:MAG: 23S rRNA (guanosine(2251)-2'-O)-methyltransferase RlmB [Candidatus Dormibacteria bacterium]